MKTTLLKWALSFLDRGLLPDMLVRRGIRSLCAQRLRDEIDRNEQLQHASFIDSMRQGPVAPVPDKANEQHYEVPAEFYEYCLGPHRKYSCGFWDENTTALDHAEQNALRLTCEHADLCDGQDILELGCGWGSLTLWMAEQYPASRITAVSNSHSQRRFIESQLEVRGLTNVRVITCDMNEFNPDAMFDRVMSIEMFEHMRNYDQLLHRISQWLNPDGKLFVHIFCHRAFTYPFETDGAANWMGQHFSRAESCQARMCLITSAKTCALRDSGDGMVVITKRPPTHGWTTWTNTLTESCRFWQAPTEMTRHGCGLIDGACSSWPALSCGDTRAGTNGLSRIIFCNLSRSAS